MSSPSSPPPPQSSLTWLGEPTGSNAFPIVRVQIVAGPDAGRSCDMTDERLVIGTHQSAGMILTDQTVSRFHCELIRDREQLVVRDLGSRNGTAIDGVAVREAFARPGSLLSLGASRLRLDPGPVAAGLRESASDRFGVMVGRSAAMRRVFAQLEPAAASDATVLLLGETGTGKEAAAESIHRESGRADGPFIVVDCGAIPTELLESELFGHERGAFTGAVRSRAGAFQAARGGTVFLDEIGELPKDLQPKLLRVLARRAVKPVGREDYVDVDVRVIAATNRDLREEINADRFRGDLYYRLAVIEVRLPALRDHTADIPALVEQMLGELAGDPAAKAQLMTPSFHEKLERHRWPGNVRELRNYVERCLTLGDQPFMDDHVPIPALTPATGVADASAVKVDLARPLKEARDEWTARFEHAYLVALLDHHSGNIRAASQAAGIDRVHMYRLLGKHRLR